MEQETLFTSDWVLFTLRSAISRQNRVETISMQFPVFLKIAYFNVQKGRLIDVSGVNITLGKFSTWT